MTSQERQEKEPGGGRSRATAETVDAILDRGIVTDSFAQVAVLSVELVGIQSECVISSADLAVPTGQPGGDRKPGLRRHSRHGDGI